jgi:hypothetical protein
MRRESIETTMRFYAGRSVEATNDVLWAAYGKNPPQAAKRGAGTQERDTLRDTSPENGQPKPRADGSKSNGIKGLRKHARQDSNLQPAD